MDTTLPRKRPRTVTVVCSECGDIDQINDRSARRKNAAGKPHVCRLCRAVADAKPNESDLAWWRDRYSQEQIDAIVGALNL